MPLLSRALGRVAPSPTIAMSDLAAQLKAQGRDVISLAAGEPDFDTPAHIAAAGIKAIRDGHTHYTAVDGMPSLKEAICAHFQTAYGITATHDEISVSNGGKQVIFNALTATLDPGDEVIIPAPFWDSYPVMTRLCGGEPVIVPCPMSQKFKLTPEALQAAITTRSKWLILNSPGNPTGAVYSHAELAALMAVVESAPGLMVLSDDIYDQIIYDQSAVTPAQIAPHLSSRILTINGFSKGYAMTGWRLGYGLGPAGMIAGMRKVQGQTTSNPSSISQYAALAALSGEQTHLPVYLAAYRSRRDKVVDALRALPGITCPVPEGAFYVFAGLAGVIGRRSSAGTLISSDEDFAMALLREAGVAGVFGAAFGMSPFIRLSFAASDEDIDKALGRITEFVAGLS